MTTQDTTSFQEAFGTSTTPTKYSNMTSRFAPIKANAHIYNSFFEDCTSSSSGGAVFCSGSSVEKLLISQSSFTSCKTSDNYAGAIYYINTGSGQCVICEICSFKCASTFTHTLLPSYGQFAYIEVNNSLESRNQVNDSSITRSTKEGTYPYYALSLNYGKISLPSVNLRVIFFP